jgi:2-polyprenyl-3-methyl-5-hydroxy-6-metoxy-1,4-benzoquinol methylase
MIACLVFSHDGAVMNRIQFAEQSNFWDSWIAESAAWEANPDNARRLQVVLEFVRSRPRTNILEVGCGSGWLSLRLAEYGYVTAVDIGVTTIDRLKKTHPHIDWIGGDFLSIDVGRDNFDLIVSMETISHVENQAFFANKIADLAAPECDLIVMTQNPFIWSRTSSLRPPQPGQLRNWPTREALINLFEPHFDLKPIRTCVPGRGDQGILRLLPFRRTLRRAFGDRWTRAEEAVGLGCSLVVTGRRLSTN